MIAKVLWQTWLNWCVIKIIYTTSVEQHLRYVLWNWKKVFARVPATQMWLPCVGYKPWTFRLFGLGKSCKPSHLSTKLICMFSYLFGSAATQGKSRRPRQKVLRCSYPSFLIKRLCSWGGSHWSQGKGNSLWNLCLPRFRAGFSPGCSGVHKHEHHFISSLFSQIGSAHHWSSNVTFKIFNQIL